ncbi:oligosaccharide flippase family protein [Pseudoalteromonas shioyasakiensis]|nr:oligosaccharide flippase family protein [Pseudoalteromonas shioyasakiensis]
MNKAFLKSFLVYGGSAGLSRILPILMLPIYLNHLSVDAYGKIEVIFAGFNLLLIFGLMQLETALQRFYYKVEDKAALFYSMVTVTAILSTVVVVVSVILSDTISYGLFDSSSESLSIVIMSVTIFFANIATICMVFLRYDDRPIVFSTMTIGQVIITACVTYMLVVSFKYGGEGYFYGLFFGWFFIAIFSFCSIATNLAFKLNINYVIESFKFALPQFPARLASFFVQFGNRFVVLSILGTQAVAVMSLSLKFAAIFQLLLLALSMAWNPFLYKNENAEDLNEKVNSLFKWILISLSVIHILTILLAELVVTTFFEGEYDAAAKYVILAIIPVQLLIIKEVVESGVRLANRTKYISYAYFTSVTVTAALMFFSTTIEQVFIATIIGALVLVLFSWYYSERFYRIKYSKLSFTMYILLLITTFGVLNV